jgi:hypothetical protein
MLTLPEKLLPFKDSESYHGRLKKAMKIAERL